MNLLKTANLILPLLLLAACAAPPPPDMSADAEKAVRAVDAEWMKAGEAKDAARFVSYYAEDAAVMFPNMPQLNGAAAIRQGMEQAFAVPGFALVTTATKYVAAKSGDLVYTQGTYKTTANDAKGKQVNDTGKYVVVFRKQADGAWKVAADIFNSDLPPAPAN